MRRRGTDDPTRALTHGDVSSAVRLYLLDALSREPAHGLLLRLLAQEEYAEPWTDLQVGGIYGTQKRLADEGLIEAVRTEREGNRPDRTMYAITGEGRDALLGVMEGERGRPA